MTGMGAGTAGAAGRPRRVTLSLPQLWAFVTLAGIFVILNLWLIRPHDFWWHVRVGEWIVTHGRVPASDLFSYTHAGAPYIHQMWLAEVVFFLLLRLGDLPLVILFHALVITSAYSVLLVVNRRAAAGDLRLAAVATLGAAALGIDNWNVRPQTLSVLLFAVVLWLVERHAQKGSELQAPSHWDGALWWLVPLFALWANVHGGYAFGLVLLGTYLLGDLLAWIGRRQRFPTQLVLVTLLSGGATLLTPHGLGMVDYLTGLFRNPVVRKLTVEWLTPTIRDRSGLLFFSYLLVLVGLLYAGRYRPPAHRTFALLAFAALALMARRNTLWFGMVAAPTMAAALHTWAAGRRAPAKARAGRPRLNLAVAGLVGVLCVLSLPWLRPYLALPEARRSYASAETPVEAVAFVRELGESRASALRVFHSEGYGSYMMWASPEVPVFVDTRMELYPVAQWRDLMAVDGARYDWQAILDRYDVDTLLLERGRHDALLEAVAASPAWGRSYEDDQAVILVRLERP